MPAFTEQRTEQSTEKRTEKRTEYGPTTTAAGIDRAHDDRSGRPALFARPVAMGRRIAGCGTRVQGLRDPGHRPDVPDRSAARSPSGRSAPVPQAARELLADASRGLGRAGAAGDPADRYAIAHLAALRAAAAVLAARARPTRGRRGSAWTLMTRVAPEFAEWAAFFAAGSAKRQAVQAGLPAGVTAREADDMVRQVAVFLSLVGDSIGCAPAAGG